MEVSAAPEDEMQCDLSHADYQRARARACVSPVWGGGGGRGGGGRGGGGRVVGVGLSGGCALTRLFVSSSYVCAAFRVRYVSVIYCI